MKLVKFFLESLYFATNALVVNKLRTLLSLLGVTIGIFAIISVFTVIDSMEYKIKTSIESLGDNTVYIQKWPWAFGGDYPWWQYLKRPVPKLKELDKILEKSTTIEAGTFMISTMQTVQYRDNSTENSVIIAATHDYNKIRSFELTSGRYFSDFESKSGRNKAIIGSEIAKNLFENIDPIDKEIKVAGKKLIVVGIFKKEGENIMNNSNDNAILIPINYARNIVDIQNENLNPMIMIKAKSNVSMNEMINELQGVMRSIHKIKPSEDDDFALNRSSLLTKGFNDLFSIIDIAGLIIGGFSILVGGFGIANIMFVSVRERTNIIGIQKALGAKNNFILLQFLYESMILCLIGGSIGLFLIFIGLQIANNQLDMDMFLSTKNIVTGLLISIIVGLISGIAPALSASRLNPVDAINSK
ncbi:MAG: ABC transporter [Bacteroidetes bacterium RIFOXYA12_FULL_33_9]|nr:MAG: ABC transporter [Bacteroidetes bacterium RIFOXYA12_FULL_33_9]